MPVLCCVSGSFVDFENNADNIYFNSFLVLHFVVCVWYCYDFKRWLKKNQAKNVIIQLKFLKSIIQKHKTGEVKDVPE